MGLRGCPKKKKRTEGRTGSDVEQEGAVHVGRPLAVIHRALRGEQALHHAGEHHADEDERVELHAHLCTAPEGRT